jgi:hypothetical protein
MLLILSDAEMQKRNGVVYNSKQKQTNSVVLVRKRTIPTERPPLVGEVSANLADRGCRVVSATNSPPPYGTTAPVDLGLPP